MLCFVFVSNMRLRKFLGKIRKVFGKIDPQHHRFEHFVESLKEFVPKNLEAAPLMVNFSKAFDSVHRGKMEQILLAYGIPKIDCYSHNDALLEHESQSLLTDFFDVVAGVLHGDALAPHLFIICLDFVLRPSINLTEENGFTLKKARNRRYPAETITDADYARDIALLTNAHSLLHSLVQAA